MFIKVSSSGGHRYARLVESFRNDDGQPRQRTLATLGRLEPGGDVDRLIRSLLEAQGRDAAAAGATSAALPDLRFLPSYSVGDVWALWQLWQSLELDGLQLAWSRSRTGLVVLALLRAMVFNRLCDPASKLGVLRWLRTVALPRGFGLEDGVVDHQQLLRAMDVLDDSAGAIADRLALLMRPLIDQDLSVVFYDLTSVRVHGEHQLSDDTRALGMSKDAGIARQFLLSLVQTADGLPISHEVHPGNTAEAPTLLPMIRKLLSRWPLERVVLVADRGLLSVDNLRELNALQSELRSAGHSVELQYVLAVPAVRYGEFAQELAALDQAQDSAKPWVAETTWRRKAEHDKAAGGKPRQRRVCAGALPSQPAGLPEPAQPGQSYRLVVAHDPEVAQRRTQERRSQIAELTDLGEQWGGKLNAQDQGQRKRGRPLSDSGAKARMHHEVEDASLAHLVKIDLHSELFNFWVDEARLRYLERLDGKLLLVTNTDAPAQEVVQRYKSMADIERGFRALKSEIENGPVHHRLPKRIRAHALICFLALLLHRVLRMRLKAGRRDESPQALLRELRRIEHQSAKTADGQVVRGITELGAQQRELFAAIDTKPPTPTTVTLSKAQLAQQADL